ncbi:hypothetical protein [Rhizomonospora bruguierae]|uniref:hypothetical protein n=1 Tax=Rhizomonospora bruguierae TaxID=1581705 RepID=UPI001BCBA9A1|nr:hypothetical protein [Micromonospora sp. NBRC 107566]
MTGAVTRGRARVGPAVATVLATVTAVLLVPAAAWAATPAGSGLSEAVRRGPYYRGGFGFIGGSVVCCLVVVGAIVLAVLLFTRGRRRPPR